MAVRRVALKPTHLKAVVEVLTSDEFESPELMAKAAVACLDELRSADTQHIIVCQYDATSGPFYLGYGPYPTQASALKAIEGGRAGIPGYGSKAVVPIVHPKRVDRKLVDVDTFAETHKGHWVKVREAVGT